MLPRFYAPDLDPDVASVILPADEARHLTRVLRLGAGAEVAVFDGRGAEYRAVVEAAVRETASLRIVERLPVPPALATRVHLVLAVLKGDSMDAAVRDATMMGVDSMQPVLTAHTDVKPSFATRPETAARWGRVAMASVKQCRRATVPAIHAPRPFDSWLASAAATDLRLMFVEPSAAADPLPLKAAFRGAAPSTATVILGPEGGWSAAELAAAVTAGCTLVTLGPLTLRADAMPTAALAAVSALATATEETQKNTAETQATGETQKNTAETQATGETQKNTAETHAAEETRKNTEETPVGPIQSTQGEDPVTERRSGGAVGSKNLHF